MRRFLNFLIFIVFFGLLAYVAWKSGYLPTSLTQGPNATSTPARSVEGRSDLRVAAAHRPERLLLESLQRLLKVENLDLQLVEYDPQKVWLELANGEIDIVVAPLGEAVQAQGRFDAGHFLFFSGLSEGLDKLLVAPDVATRERVAVPGQAATQLLARKLLPEADVIVAKDAAEAELWLKNGIVDAMLIDASITSPDLEEQFEVLTSTSSEEPMPTVIVMSRRFAENAHDDEFGQRRKVLTASLETWRELIGYFDTQPDLLKSNLRQEAEQHNINIDRLLDGYSFLTPERGREKLTAFQADNGFKTTLDLLVLARVDNLRAPDWDDVVEVPGFLDSAWVGESPSLMTTLTGSPTSDPSPSDSPTPESTPTAEKKPVSTTDPEPEVKTEVASNATQQETKYPPIPPTYTYLDAEIPSPWPAVLLETKVPNPVNFAPALSPKQVVVVSKDTLFLISSKNKRQDIPLDTPPSTEPLTDGRNFFYAGVGAIVGINSRGKEIWRVEVEGEPYGLSEVTTDFLIYAIHNDENSRIISLDPVDGEVLWEIRLSSPPTSRPVLGSSPSPIVAVLDESGQARAWDLITGRQRWTRKLAAPSFIPPSIGYGLMVINRPNGAVTALNVENGEQVWSFDMGTPLTAPATVTRRGVLIPSKDTYLYLLGNEKGNIVWKTRLSDNLAEPAVVAGERIIQSSENGRVYTIDLDDGALISSMEIDNTTWLSRPVFYDNRPTLLDSKGQVKIYSSEK